MWKFLKSKFSNKKRKIYPPLAVAMAPRVESFFAGPHQNKISTSFKYKIEKALQEFDFYSVEKFLIESKSEYLLDDFQDIFDCLFSSLPANWLEGAQSLIALLIQYDIHKLKNSAGQTLLILINQYKKQWPDEPRFRSFFTEKILQADRVGVNHADKEGNTALYYALLTYIEGHYDSPWTLECIKGYNPISILIRYEASIKCINESLLKFFTCYSPFYSASILDKRCFCPDERRHWLIAAIVIKQMLFNKESFDYHKHNGCKRLILQSIYEYNPKEKLRTSEEMVLYFLNQWGDMQVVESFLMSQPLRLMQQGNLNQFLFKLFLKIKSPIIVSKIQEQLLKKHQGVVMVYHMMSGEYESVLMNDLISNSFSELFILLCNYFIKYDNPVFVVDKYYSFLRACLESAKPSSEILFYLAAQKNLFMNTDEEKIWQQKFLFTVLCEVDKCKSESVRVIEELIIGGLCFSQIEFLRLNDKFDKEEINTLEKKRHAILTYYDSLRTNLKQKIHAQFPKTISAPCVDIISEYLMPNPLKIEITPKKIFSHT